VGEREKDKESERHHAQSHARISYTLYPCVQHLNIFVDKFYCKPSLCGQQQLNVSRITPLNMSLYVYIKHDFLIVT